MALISAIFTYTNHTKKLNPWPNSSASCVANFSRLSACQGVWSHLKLTWALVDIWQASETSHNKSNLGNFHHQYLTLAELLVNVYSYCLMVKSMSWCCVHGSQLFSNLVTYVANFHLIFCNSWAVKMPLINFCRVAIAMWVNNSGPIAMHEPYKSDDISCKITFGVKKCSQVK